MANFDHHRRRAPGQPSLSAWVDVDGLDLNNSEEKIAARGFTLSAGDDAMGFATGVIKIPKPSEDGRSSGLHRFLLSSVFTGRSYPKVDPAGKNIIPPGYDSLYVYDADALEREREAKDYSHEYIVRDLSQVLPQFVVHFTVAAVTDADRTRNAKAKEAHHAANGGTDVMGDILDLLDRKLHWSQESVRNKFHAINALQSELSQASDEYNRSLDASHQSDERLEACRELLTQRRGIINDKLAEVQNNSKLVEESLYTMLQDALFSLQDETQRKLNMLLGEELEIRRRLAHIDWSEDCLSRFRAELGPPDFVHAWRNHRTVRKSLYKYRDIGASVLDRVHADIKVMGGVRIVTERGPTSAIVNGGASGVEQKSLAEIALISEEGTTEFRREVFRTSSPLKAGGETGGGAGNGGLGGISESDMSLGTSSLAQSFREEIGGGGSGGGRPGQQAPNSYALAPTMATLGLPSSNMRPAGDIGDSALLSTINDNSIGSTHEEWLRVMRQNEGLPEPQPVAVDNVGGAGSPVRVGGQYAALGDGGDAGSPNAQKGSSGFRAVDSFVEAQGGNSNDGYGDSDASGNASQAQGNPEGPPVPPGPPSPAFGQALPPPPMQSPDARNGGDENEDSGPSDNMGPDNTVPAGPMGKYWRRHSLTRLKQQMRRNMTEPTLPSVDSDIVTSPNDRAMVYASLPKPMTMELRRLELDPSCRTVEDLQSSLAEHVDGSNEGMLLLCQSGDYKFGAYAERMFQVREDEEQESYLVDSHYGTHHNYLFSITHDLKVGFCRCRCRCHCHCHCRCLCRYQFVGVGVGREGGRAGRGEAFCCCFPFPTSFFLTSLFLLLLSFPPTPPRPAPPTAAATSPNSDSVSRARQDEKAARLDRGALDNSFRYRGR